jgi:hypothetical protein
MIRLQFLHAPPDFLDQDGLVRRLIEVATGQETELVSSRPSLVVESVMQPRMRKLATSLRPTAKQRDVRHNPQPSVRGARSIWITGENVRPPGGSWDGYLSFDLDPLEGRNAYFPIWWMPLGLLGPRRRSLLGRDLGWTELLERRHGEASRRERFMCAFIGNPTPVRWHAIQAFRRIGEVDVYGTYGNRITSSKHDISTHYRFQLCFENDLYPGYVTEKPIDAWAAGCIPVWWGSDPAGYLNPRALINAADYRSLAELGQAVARLDSDPAAMDDVTSLPLLSRPPDLRDAISVIRSALG